MQNIFQRLQEMDQKCVERAKKLPSIDGASDEWTGIGFKVAGISLLSNMGEVTEILNLPPFTRVPGVHSWVAGIANVRGALLPLMDLKQFVTGEPISHIHLSRVMTINHNGVNTGLIVEEVQGMRHFSKMDQVYELPAVNDYLQPYIRQAFKKDENYWPVFSMHALIEDERFLHASL
ncbi:hypothetical protein MNBD_GAMMA07-2322 [hydrothermal vent metagenome]|uniref:CheW-like domain-containing protein n=1 Tax=hydrothermal vent metagenome TaxID=652676 RepID=A0A3B0WKA1_9ZZZZ